jgi:Tol biopolymer transport system component
MRRLLLSPLLVASLALHVPSASAAVPLELPRTILFSRTDGTGTHIFSVEPDGTGLTQLTSGPDADVDAAWNVDASAITFTRRTATAADTWIMEPDGADPHLFLPNARSLVWSPSGEAVAFVRVRKGNHDLWTAAADGSNRRRLTTHTARDVQPVWWFEDRLTFVSDRSGRDRIYGIETDGTGVERLTSAHGEQRHPSWFGDELVYEQDDGKDRDIVRLRVTTGSLQVELGGQADDRDPDVAMDGELVFRRTHADGSSSLIHRWIGGEGPGTVLSGTEGVADRAPAWAPASAWLRAQDDQAKGNLLEAAATAQGIRDETGSFDDADVDGMHAVDPTLTYVNEPADSVRPEEISIDPDGTRWSAAALSDSGACFYIRLDDIEGLTYGMDFTASASTLCSGDEAAGSAIQQGW